MTAGAFVSGGLNVIMLVPFMDEFEKIGIANHSIGIAPRLVEYTGVTVPVGV